MRYPQGGYRKTGAATPAPSGASGVQGEPGRQQSPSLLDQVIGATSDPLGQLLEDIMGETMNPGRRLLDEVLASSGDSQTKKSGWLKEARRRSRGLRLGPFGAGLDMLFGLGPKQSAYTWSLPDGATWGPGCDPMPASCAPNTEVICGPTVRETNSGCCFTVQNPLSCEHVATVDSNTLYISHWVEKEQDAFGHRGHVLFTFRKNAGENPDPMPLIRARQTPRYVPISAMVASPVPRFRDRKVADPRLQPPGPPDPPFEELPGEPGPGTREIKWRLYNYWVWFLAHQVTETKDLIEALHKALPVSLQCYYRDGKQERGYPSGRGKRFHKGTPPGKKCTMSGQFRALYHAIGKMGEGEALEWYGNALQNVFVEMAQDKVQGKLAGDAGKKLADQGVPFPLAGPAL